MSTEPPKAPDSNTPDSPWRLNPARIVLLALGVLIVIYIVGALSGSLTNYQMVREGTMEQRAQQAAPAEAAPAETAPAETAPAN